MRMTLVALVALTGSLVVPPSQGFTQHSLKAFHAFMATHNKRYSSREEYKARYSIFRTNMARVALLQATEQGTATYGATHLADLTEEEFKRQYLGYTRSQVNDDPEIHWPPADIPDVEVPESFDWRDHGAVSEVKNQGMCGSCWAFSVTGNVEGQQAVKNGKLLSLSEQELVDCDPLDYGCGGGLMENAYKTLLDIGGLEQESDYGYDGETEACQFNRSKVAVRVTGGVEISSDEHQMAQWLLKNGPISIAINAFAMQFYMGGVSHPFSLLCSPSGLDHGVLIVGFGVHTTWLLQRRVPFWIVKNSWGPSWGEGGYYRVYRGGGVCGLNTMASSATVAGSVPTTVSTIVPDTVASSVHVPKDDTTDHATVASSVLGNKDHNTLDAIEDMVEEVETD